MTIPRKQLGSAGPELTVVGMGTWAIGGTGWGPVDDQDSIKAIQRAIDLGINWFDTADIYGKGHSEEILGRAIRDRRDQVLVATKVFVNFEGEKTFGDLSPAHIRSGCEASLRRLGIDHIDLYQFHSHEDTTGTPLEESWAEMVKLKHEGKIRHLGVSNFEVSHLETCERIHHIDSLQPQYNLFWREAEEDVLPWCLEHGVGVVTYGPLAYGMLTGKFTIDSKFADNDWRGNGKSDYYQYLFKPGVFEQRLEQVDRLRLIAERLGRSVAQLAIAWVASHPAVTSAIVGAKHAAQVEANVANPGLLTPEERAEVENAIAEPVSGRRG